MNSPSNHLDTEVTSPKKKQVTGMLMAMEGFFNEALNDIRDSLKLWDLDQPTRLTKKIEKRIDDPWIGLSEPYDSIIENFLKAKESFLRKVLQVIRQKSNGAILDQAKILTDEGATHVFLVLKKDNDDVREVFYKSLEHFDALEIFRNYPIIFHFIDKDLMGELSQANEIQLDYDEQSPESM